MSNLPPKTANLSPHFDTAVVSGGRLVAGWWQLVATEILACLCGKLGGVAGMAAFFKTFPKRIVKRSEKNRKTRIGITIGITCHCCHQEHAP